MTAEELRAKINFSYELDIYNRRRMRATLVLESELIYDPEFANTHALDEMKDRLRWQILRAIYDDQRRELYNALMDVLRETNGFGAANWEALDKARSRLIAAAQHQPPLEELSPATSDGGAATAKDTVSADLRACSRSV